MQYITTPEGISKKRAITLFGNQSALARALGISRSTVWRWDNELDQALQDQILGAALRLGKLRLEAGHLSLTSDSEEG